MPSRVKPATCGERRSVSKSCRITCVRTCGVKDCGQKHRAKGLCAMHYERLRTTGVIGAAAHLKARSGSGTTNKQGYRRVYVDGKLLRENRVVMARTLGRDLYSHEEVHHKNGQRADNHPANLELWSTSQPRGQRVEDKTDWALWWLQKYAPECLNINLLEAVPGG